MKKEKIVGIYSIKNRETEKRYIGSSFDIISRWSDHLDNFKKLKCNQKLKNSIKIHGIEVFEFEILEELPTSITTREIEKIETAWIAIFEAHTEKGYNIRKEASSNKGMKIEDVTNYRLASQLKAVKMNKKCILYNLDGTFFRVCESRTEACKITESDIYQDIKSLDHRSGNFLVFEYSENYVIQVTPYKKAFNLSEENRLKRIEFGKSLNLGKTFSQETRSRQRESRLKYLEK